MHTSRLLHFVHQIRCRLMVFAVRVSVLVLQHFSPECVPESVCDCVCVRATANGSYFRRFYALCFGFCFVTLFGHFVVAVAPLCERVRVH